MHAKSIIVNYSLHLRRCILKIVTYCWQKMIKAKKPLTCKKRRANACKEANCKAQHDVTCAFAESCRKHGSDAFDFLIIRAPLLSVVRFAHYLLLSSQRANFQQPWPVFVFPTRKGILFQKWIFMHRRYYPFCAHCEQTVNFSFADWKIFNKLFSRLILFFVIKDKISLFVFFLHFFSWLKLTEFV